MNFMLNMTSFGTQYRKPPFIALLATAGVVGFWAVRLLSPLPASLPSEPIAATVASTGQPLQPAELWLTSVAPQTSKIKLLANIGSPSGQGRAVFNVDGQSVAGNTGESPLPGWRILAVRPATVDLEIDGKNSNLESAAAVIKTVTLPVLGFVSTDTRCLQPLTPTWSFPDCRTRFDAYQYLPDQISRRT